MGIDEKAKKKEYNELKEYDFLRNEISQKTELHNTLLTFTITTVVAILAFIFAQKEPYSPFLFLIPMCILIPMSMRIAYYRTAMARLSAYIIVYLEDHIEGIHWETRNRQVLLRISNPENKDNTSQDKAFKSRSKMQGRFRNHKIHRFLMKRYYECFALCILCYFLYAYHYYNQNLLCPLTIFNLCWPIGLVLFELLVTIQIDSVDESKEYWYNEWNSLKESESIIN